MICDEFKKIIKWSSEQDDETHMSSERYNQAMNHLEKCDSCLEWMMNTGWVEDQKK